MRIATYQDDIDFPALLEELASGACTLSGVCELHRYDALSLSPDGDLGVACLMARVWVPSLHAGVGVRMPWTPGCQEAAEGIPTGSRVAFFEPAERSYLDYAEGAGFALSEQHVLYARGIVARDGEPS